MGKSLNVVVDTLFTQKTFYFAIGGCSTAHTVKNFLHFTSYGDNFPEQIWKVTHMLLCISPTHL